MRFHDLEDEGRLHAMVTSGAVSREPLEAAVGGRSVSLLDALVEYESAFPPGPWIAWGIRQGKARLHGTTPARGFLRSLHFSETERDVLVENWYLPFGKNAFQQTLVAGVPGWEGGPAVQIVAQSGVVPCILTLRELGNLRKIYRELW